MVIAHLHRIDADANMARFYSIDLVPNLFGEIAVLRTWGRIGTHGRTSVETCASPEDAEQAASRTLRQKVRRGCSPRLGVVLPSARPTDRQKAQVAAASLVLLDRVGRLWSDSSVMRLQSQQPWKGIHSRGSRGNAPEGRDGWGTR